VPIESATPASSESDTAEPDEDAATPEPGINTAPISSGSLDEMLDTMADDSQLSASRADGTLKRDVLRTIITNLAKSGCRVSIHGASVTSETDDNGVWSETWDLSICDTRRALKIRFSPTSGGGTDFRITQ
jgi:hypothetical protein